jgi:hypothetical protein
MKKHIPLPFIFLVFFSCKKQIIIREIEVEKKYSWAEIKRFNGLEKVFLSSGSNTNAIYLQQPYFFTRFLNQYAFDGISVYGASLPENTGIRLPISATYTAVPDTDSGLRIMNNRNPITTPTGGYYNLKQLDPTLTDIQTNYFLLFKCMAINKNGVLLLSYRNNRPTHPLTFMLFGVKTYIDYPYSDTLFTRQITLPVTSNIGYVRYLAAIDDYFMVQITGDGTYKIKEDGSFRKVFGSAVVDAIYEWQGKLYAHAE